MSDRYETGSRTRRQVLGDAHVDRAEAARSDFDAPFLELITEAAWGTVWASDAISLRPVPYPHLPAHETGRNLVCPHRPA